MVLSGYTPATFGPAQSAAFATGVARTLSVPPSSVTVTGVSSARRLHAVRHLLQSTAGVKVAFSVQLAVPAASPAAAAAAASAATALASPAVVAALQSSGLTAVTAVTVATAPSVFQPSAPAPAQLVRSSGPSPAAGNGGGLNTAVVAGAAGGAGGAVAAALLLVGCCLRRMMRQQSELGGRGRYLPKPAAMASVLERSHQAADVLDSYPLPQAGQRAAVVQARLADVGRPRGGTEGDDSSEIRIEPAHGDDTGAQLMSATAAAEAAAKQRAEAAATKEAAEKAAAARAAEKAAAEKAAAEAASKQRAEAVAKEAAEKGAAAAAAEKAAAENAAAAEAAAKQRAEAVAKEAAEKAAAAAAEKAAADKAAAEAAAAKQRAEAATKEAAEKAAVATAGAQHNLTATVVTAPPAQRYHQQPSRTVARAVNDGGQSATVRSPPALTEVRSRPGCFRVAALTAAARMRIL